MNKKKLYSQALKAYHARVAELPKPSALPVRTRSGCRVMWKVYATEEDAKLASAHAAAEADYKSGQGYDFGYCCPGSIAKVHDGWEVCFP